MSFRSDHDAALARADALEREVERERERAEKLRRERDELEARVARLEAGQRPARPRLIHTPGLSAGESQMVTIAGVMLVIFFFVVLLARYA